MLFTVQYAYLLKHVSMHALVLGLKRQNILISNAARFSLSLYAKTDINFSQFACSVGLQEYCLFVEIHCLTEYTMRK